MILYTLVVLLEYAYYYYSSTRVICILEYY